MTNIIMSYVQFDGENEPIDVSDREGQIHIDFLIEEIYKIYSHTLHQPMAQAFAKYKTHPNEFLFINKIVDPEEEEPSIDPLHSSTNYNLRINNKRKVLYSLTACFQFSNRSQAIILRNPGVDDQAC